MDRDCISCHRGISQIQVWPTPCLPTLPPCHTANPMTSAISCKHGLTLRDLEAIPASSQKELGPNLEHASSRLRRNPTRGHNTALQKRGHNPKQREARVKSPDEKPLHVYTTTGFDMIYAFLLLHEPPAKHIVPCDIHLHSCTTVRALHKATKENKRSAHAQRPTSTASTEPSTNKHGSNA